MIPDSLSPEIVIQAPDKTSARESGDEAMICNDLRSLVTTSIHLRLGPCVGLIALLSPLRSSCFCGRLSLMRSRWPSHCNRCFCIVIAIGSSHARSKLSEFLILFHLETTESIECTACGMYLGVASLVV